MGLGSAGYIYDGASALTFLEPGCYEIVKFILVKNRAYLSCFASNSMFLSVGMSFFKWETCNGIHLGWGALALEPDGSTPSSTINPELGSESFRTGAKLKACF